MKSIIFFSFNNRNYYTTYPFIVYITVILKMRANNTISIMMLCTPKR